MYIQIGLFSDGENKRISLNCDSINESISSVKSKVRQHFSVEESATLRLFYGGKELKDEHTLFTYGVKLNNVLQVSICLPKEDNSAGEVSNSGDGIETDQQTEKGSTSNEKSEMSLLDMEVIEAIAAELDSIEEKCKKCKDNANVRCRMCSCADCGGKDSPDKQLVCDECNKLYHLWCLPVPLNELPPEDEDWYCPNCKNNDKEIIELKEESHMQKKSKESKCGEKWGRGLSCVGRTKVSETVMKDHFGPIPGIEVGTCWRFRFQASEVGVHTPLVAGIHGKEKLGAYSIVFGCSYDGDVDLGSEIYYTGSGGKPDGEGQMRCRVGGPQVKDQELKKGNKALAMNCHAPFNDTTGANAGKDWRLGKPVRVLRSGNARGAKKRSLYLPKTGVRYDGIYKVVKYWPEKNTSGFIVWRYFLRRDDTSPAPWTKEGKARIKKLGLKCVFPEGWMEKGKVVYNGSRKRKLESNDCESRPQKTLKKCANVSDKFLQRIEKDERNGSVWQSLIKHKSVDALDFKNSVIEAFKCAYCLSLVNDPITTFCSHNICKCCFEESRKRGINICPICRQKFKKRGKLPTLNTHLKQILNELLI